MLKLNCDCCNNDQPVTVILNEVFDHKKISKKKYDVVKCDACGHSFIFPMPSGMEEIINLYPPDYYAYSKNLQPDKSIKTKLKSFLISLYYGKYSGNSFIRTLQKLFYTFLKRTINEPPIIANGKLLDMGCGNGQYLYRAKQFGWDTYGIELCEKAVDVAQSIGLEVKKGSAEETGYPNGFFDVVRIWNLLEHIISPRKALAEVYRILKKGRYLLIYVPNFGSLDRKYFSKYWASLEIPRHLHHFSFRSLESYLQQIGFILERRMYPGTIFSMLAPTIRIMRENKINPLSIVFKVTAVILRKALNRFFGKYFEDIGICILARKI